MKPRKPIPRESSRRKDERRERERVVDAAFKRDRWQCRAALAVRDVECDSHLDGHEIIPRSAWAEGHLVLDNVLTVCRSHHRWIDLHPTEAHALGLHGFSYERTD